MRLGRERRSRIFSGEHGYGDRGHGDCGGVAVGIGVGIRLVLVVLLGLAFVRGLPAQTGTASLHGQVTDPSGAVVPGATVQVTTPDGQMQSSTVGSDGGYRFRALAPGLVSVAVSATGFSPYKKDAVNLVAGQDLALNVAISLAGQREQLTVSAEALTLDTSPENNASEVVITEKELDALPDDPDELQADLEALAGPGAGPSGGQMYIDGFTAGQLPPKSSIREIRINSNPFSAEFDSVGFGRIEIFTKPGGGPWHGSISLNHNDAVFNSRNPFAPERGDFDSNQIDGNVGGGLSKTMSLFINVDSRLIDNSSVISAEILNPTTFAIEPYSALYPRPQSRVNAGPRFDWQLKKNNTLTVRYQFVRSEATNSGVGNLSLPVQASNTLTTEHQVQITDSQYFGNNIVYETRFQYLYEPTSNIAANIIPSISVPGAFSGGGSGNLFDTQNHYELQSFASINHSKQFIKFGGRVRELTDSNNSNTAFFGAFNFSTLAAYQTMVQSNYANCNTSTPMGPCGPNQYSVTGGNPRAYVSVFDVEPFIQDDWRVRPNLTISAGLRFETQNHIHDHDDWAPRLAAAWALGRSKTSPKFVLRAGWGVFYTRLASLDILQALRQNGITEQQVIVTNPSFYCGPTTPGGTTLVTPDCPTLAQLTAPGNPYGATSVPTIYQIAPDFHAPYIMQTSASLERQVSKTVQLSVTYNNARGNDQLVQANVNAPVLPGTEIPAPYCAPGVTRVCGVYPNGITENIYQYESAGLFRQNQLFANVTVRPGTGKILSRMTLNGYYVLNYADSTPNAAANNPGTGGFLMNPYNLREDYGPAGGKFGTRHTGFLLGTIQLPYGMGLSPTLQVSSGAPYTITLGKDLLGTSILNQRPAFVSSATCATTIITGNNYCTPVGTFNSVPTNAQLASGQGIVGVNSLRGPRQFTLNLRLTKTFTFGAKSPEGAARNGRGAGGQQGGLAGAARAAGGGGRAGFGGGGGGGGRRGNAGGGYSFTASINARNVFNNVNLSAPIGSLGSPLFGQSESLSNVGPGGSVVANRQVYLQGTFAF